MEVSIHLTDVDFSSRCALQDCYVIPAPCHKTVSIDKAAVEVGGGEVDHHVDTGTLPEGILVSPYLLHPNKSNCGPRPLALLWRCGACGKEQCVAREAMSLFNQRSSKKGASRGTASRRSEPAVCPDCYACPRCNASALSISMSREVLYVACCSYCHWRHGVACKDFDGLLASLSAATASKMMLSYNRAVGEWRRSCDEKIKRREEMLLSLSRVANAEHKKGTMGDGGGAPQHSAVVLEELRSAIYGRTLKNRDNSPEWIPFSAPGEMAAATPCETPTASPEEGEKKGVVLFPDNADALTRTTQMEQHGFFFPSNHPFWDKQSESAATAPFLLMQNIRLPLTAMVIPSAQDGVRKNATAYQRDSSFLFVVNGVRRDPSFEQIVQVLQARGGSESRRCQLVTVKLAAAFCLPVLQQQSRHPASDESRRWFTWRNFGDDVLCIRRFTMEKQVGGVFDASLVISAGADASEWVSLPPRSGNRASVGETFCITLQRTAGARAMVGFVVEVQTMLPTWPGEGAEETPGAGAPSLVGEMEGTTKRCPHVVRRRATVRRMDGPELFVISTSESEDGDGTDGANVADVSALAEDARSNLSFRHCGVENMFIDEVLFGDRDRRSVLLPDTGARATDADSLSSSSSDSDRSLFAQELVGEETKRLSQGPGVVEDKGTLDPHEPLTSTAVLRSMTCADVRAVLEPFFRRKEAAKARFDAVQKWLAEEMAAKTTRMKKSMLERWRRLVNISNWGDGSSSRDDILFPEALVPPAATLLGVLGPSVAKNVLPELQHLRPHQIDGIRFLWSILAEGPVGRVPAVGCILAHTMGLGKTCQVVIFLHLLLNEKRGCLGRSQRVLIVVPKSTRPGWQKEFSTWSQYFPLAHRILPIMIDERDGMKRRLDLYRSWWSEGGVLLVGYEMLLGLTKLSKEGSREDKKGCEFTDLLICDEAHRLKSTRLQISAALRGLHPLRRLLLTGTPLQNHLQEYWAMVDFAVHKYFEKRRFQEFFINPIEASVAQEASSRVVATARMKTFALIRELRHFVQRVDSTPLRDELPPLHEYVLVIPLSALQVRLYNRFLHLARLEQSKFNFLQAVTYANKISAHPQLLFDSDPASPLKEILSEVESSPDDDDNNNNNNNVGDNMGKGNRRHGDRRRTAFSGPVNEGYAELFQPPVDYTAAPEDGVKLYIAIRIIKAAMLRGERALFFSLSTKMLSLFEGIIAEMNRRWQQDGSLPRPIRFCRLDGNSSGAERENTLRSFNSLRGADVLLLSMKAGGVGINITSATRVILADSGFNPADDRQAIGRAYRYGQTRPVFVYRLVCYQTLEHRMFQQKVAKEWLFHTIVEEASLKRDALTGLRLQSMIQLLGRSLEVSSEVPALTDEQRDSTARLFTEDAVLAELADSIIYVESHEVYLQHDELVQYGKEEREFYEEYQKKGVFNIDSYMDGVNVGNETEQRKRQREKHQEDIGRQTKTLTALVDDVICGRAEQDPRLRHLLRMMGITVDASGVVSVSSMQETQRRTREPIAVDGEDGSNSSDDRLIRRLQGEKLARTETASPLRPIVLNQSDDDDEDSILFEGKKKKHVALVIDPSIYEPYKPGRNAYNAIFIDEDEV